MRKRPLLIICPSSRTRLPPKRRQDKAAYSATDLQQYYIISRSWHMGESGNAFSFHIAFAGAVRFVCSDCSGIFPAACRRLSAASSTCPAAGCPLRPSTYRVPLQVLGNGRSAARIFGQTFDTNSRNMSKYALKLRVNCYIIGCVARLAGKGIICQGALS